MTRQFVLIDHSIEDASGHYLEYAKRVLRAAKAAGFRTLLAVNQRAQNLECPEADQVVKSFSRTFWENQAQSKFRTLAGFLLKRDTLAVEAKYADTFADELAVMLRQMAVTESDIVFIPTLGTTELMGISQYSCNEVSVPVQWHLLFRRDVPPPDSCFDVRSHLNHWRTKAAFTLANAKFQLGTRYFYTDTEELTKRYESLAVGDFKTLPIPIDDQLGFKKPWRHGPLVVSYLGDMRAEKGIQLLPQVIKSLRQDGFDASKVLFRIQGNMPSGDATRATVLAKAALSDEMLTGVEVLNGPLDSDAYRELILGSDIILIPYSPNNYAARSSGIFAEAVAAGIPTIHPLASWMGRNATGQMHQGYGNPDEISANLKETLLDYQRHETASLGFCRTWREKHSANRLTQILIENKNTARAISA